jgi:tocopherol cyclase
MLRFIRSTLNPAWYQGQGKKPPLFEGWYFKVVDESERHRYAIIPGVFLKRDAVSSHAFIQVLDGNSGRGIYQSFPIDAFWSSEDTFDIRVGPNRFSAERISLDLSLPELSLKGELAFESLSPWPVTLLSPGIMGWYAWVPFMECYHGVVSLDHRIAGALTIDEQHIDFSNGRGYIEKDWGKAFPKAWIWFQTNHFETPGTSLTASVAIIPWLRSSFAGFIIGLWHHGTLYRFATYSGASIEKLEIMDECVTLVVRDKQYRLELRASRADGGLLQAPTISGMDRRIAETLNASAEAKLSKLEPVDAQVLLHESGRHAGLEAVGDLRKLIEMSGPR